MNTVAVAHRHPWLTVAAALVSLSAVGGAVGLIGGGLSIGAELEQRLPFHSPVVGGIALAVLVGLPFAVLAALAWLDDPRTPILTMVAGVMVVGWILVELAFIREFSFFHPLYVVVGVAFALVGRHQAMAERG